MCTNQNSSAQCLTRPLRRNSCRLGRGPGQDHLLITSGKVKQERPENRGCIFLDYYGTFPPSRKKKAQQTDANRQKSKQAMSQAKAQRGLHTCLSGLASGRAQLQRGKLIAVTWRKNNICSSCSVTRETKAISVHLRLDHNHRLAARPRNKSPHLIGKIKIPSAGY